MQGDFLVLEQDTHGKNTTQRLQLFNDKKSRYQNTLLQRGRYHVASMNGIALENKGNVVVTLKENESIGGVQVRGAWVLKVHRQTNPQFSLSYTSVAVDKEGRIPSWRNSMTWPFIFAGKAGNSF